MITGLIVCMLIFLCLTNFVHIHYFTGWKNFLIFFICLICINLLIADMNYNIDFKHDTKARLEKLEANELRVERLEMVQSVIVEYIPIDTSESKVINIIPDDNLIPDDNIVIYGNELIDDTGDEWCQECGRCYPEGISCCVYHGDGVRCPDDWYQGMKCPHGKLRRKGKRE